MRLQIACPNDGVERRERFVAECDDKQ